MSVVVYTKNNCPDCVKAKTLLAVKGEPYNEISVNTDIMREEFMKAFPNARKVPYIIINGEHIAGYEKLVEYFDNRKQLLTEA